MWKKCAIIVRRKPKVVKTQQILTAIKKYSLSTFSSMRHFTISRALLSYSFFFKSPRRTCSLLQESFGAGDYGLAQLLQFTYFSASVNTGFFLLLFISVLYF